VPCHAPHRSHESWQVLCTLYLGSMVYPNVKTKNDQIEEGTQPEGWTQVTEQNERQQVFYNLKPDEAVHGYKIQNTLVSSFSPSERYRTL
jgi:hypothetical protein